MKPISSSGWKALRAALLLLTLSGCERSEPASGGTAGAASRASSAHGDASSPTAPTALEAGNRGWVLGERYPYRLKITSSLAFGDQANTFDFDLNASVILAPTAVGSTETSVFVAWVEPHIVSRVPDPSGQFEKIAKQLETFGCFFTLKDGLIADLHLAPGLSPMTVSIYRQLGAALQLARARSQAKRYEVLEYDGTGQYLAEYTEEPSGSFSKRKVKYQRILSKQDAAAEPALSRIVPEIVSSRGELQVSPQGRLSNVRLHDELRVSGAQLPVHSKTSVSLDAEPATRGAEVRDWRALSDKLQRLGADEPYGAPVGVEALDAARIKGHTFDSIVAKLRSLPSSAEPLPASSEKPLSDAEKAKQDAENAELSSLFVALGAVFRQDPKAVARAMQLVKSQPNLANTLVDALASSGSPVAHKALSDLLTAPQVSPKLRQRALTGLARTPRPSPVAIEALKAELARKPFSTDAIYGLGSYSRYFRDQGDAAQSKALGDLLVDKLQHADDIVYRLTVALGGITNAGYTPALSAVIPHLSDRRAPVRAAAVLALQSMRGEQVEALIASTLSSDTEYSVALSAIDAARAHEPTEALVQALSSAARTSSNANVRYRAVELLLGWQKKRPEIQGTLRQVAEKDSEEQVRALARSAPVQG